MQSSLPSKTLFQEKKPYKLSRRLSVYIILIALQQRFPITNCIYNRTNKKGRAQNYSQSPKQEGNRKGITACGSSREPLPTDLGLFFFFFFRFRRRRTPLGQEVESRGREQRRPDLAAEHHHHQAQHERRHARDWERRPPRLPLRRPRRERPRGGG
jgi:hypothetical protein